jgi:aspartyl-tRNA(Asn)/glutamyl-tRNA(Gln) amidotransferase subunit C
MITEDDVKKIAKLARLKLAESEVKLYQGQLVKILDSMAELEKLDTKNVAPTASVLGVRNVMREDTPIPFSDPEKLLSNAPEREGPFYKVRKVIE